ncbi:hypothetical protein [Photorhabdus sp. RM71S]|uniref:hypothetical protein n=1 Tax=Photorhabdus sp. RM71S TaxID=3342824 RepID=UPI0036D9431F
MPTIATDRPSEKLHLLVESAIFYYPIENKKDITSYNEQDISVIFSIEYNDRDK